MRNRLLTISAAMLALIAAGCGDSEPATFAQQSSLNVLLITLDTTRADRFRSYGYDRPTTPHFDELATDGVLFELAISTASATPIAHASIMTGLNPYHHGVRVIYAGSGYYLDEDIPTLASELNKRGWETGAFLSSFTVSEFYGFEHGFDTFDNGLKNPADSIMQKKGNKFGWEVRTNQRRSDETADAAIAWISKKRKSPFFAWIHFWDPHDPALQPPDRVLAKFPQRVPGRPSRKRDTYDAEIAYVDENFGRIVAALEKNGQYDNTIIVVIADHGEGLGDHGWVNHRLLYQEQIRLPLIVRLPGGPKNVRVADLVRNIDVYPTIMEALGVTLPKKPDGRPMIDGLSMISLMNGEPQPPRIAYADQLNKWDDNAGMVRRRPLDQLIYCAMDKTWKLIYRQTAAEQSLLYNIAQDPRETNNLYRPDHPQAVRLKAALDAFGGYRKVPFLAGANGPGRRHLEAMGYIERAGGDEESPDPTSQPASSSRPAASTSQSADAGDPG